MHFVYAPPWWLLLLIAGAIGGLTYVQYRRPLAVVSRGRRATLTACRALVLSLLVLLPMRPYLLVPPQSGRGAVVAVLVDRSRSMRVPDADGQPRLARALSLLRSQLLPALATSFAPVVYGVGDRLEPASLEQLTADGPKSDLGVALAAVRDRYRGQRLAGIILLTDGADTTRTPAPAPAGGPAVFTVGIGSPDSLRDREVAALTAGEQRLDQATVDLHVSARSSGFGRAPFQLRVLANGREVESRRVVPVADGAPRDEVFTVAPDTAAPTVFTAEVAVDASESVPENNARRVLVNPAGRRRRLLMIEGAPGFEHSFMRRAWARDPGLEVDVVGRKGKNVDGQDTFFVQAAASRTASLVHGFPERREDLFAYDGLILANVDGDALTRAQLTMAADFVGTRGGGLLVVGGRSFAARGLTGTPLEPVLPVELSDRRGGVVRAANATARAEPNRVVLTSEGEGHPVMRIGSSLDETKKRWSAFPVLAFVAPVGGPRPGASVLAVTSASTGVVYPVAAVHTYGRGRSMSFAGEASWRWKMMLPSADRSFEYFWRQAARWITGASLDPVSITAPEDAMPGEDVSIAVDVRDAVYASVGDATVEATLTGPSGASQRLAFRPDAGGRYVSMFRAETQGVYRVNVEARRGGAAVGGAEQWVDVGGADREFADPRLNEGWLRRVARASGGRYVRADEASKIAGWLGETAAQQAAPERRELWHEPWALAIVVALLSAEWILRRRWGLR